VSWRNHILAYDVFMVPKGSPDRDLAMRLINDAVSAKGQTAFASLLPYGAVHRDARPTPPPGTFRQLIQGGRKPLVVQNQRWWADNIDTVQPVWTEWLARLKE
jgi:putative spermidine/putrescine transport system substrate-binding protein